MNINKLIQHFLISAVIFSLGMAQDFSAYIHITGGTSGVDYDLNFGFSPDATDGYDGNFDLYAPPAPPPPFLDAALGWGGDRYYS